MDTFECIYIIFKVMNFNGDLFLYYLGPTAFPLLVYMFLENKKIRRLLYIVGIIIFVIALLKIYKSISYDAFSSIPCYGFISLFMINLPSLTHKDIISTLNVKKTKIKN